MQGDDERSSRMMPYVVEFVKFSTGFVAIIAGGLFMLHVANAMAL